MTKPVVLDLFCCQGGASRGYVDAGFDVIGVDHIDQKLYPYPFYVADALEFVVSTDLHFDAVHASPPCQGETLLQFVNNNRENYDRLIEPTREVLTKLGKPFIIENVQGAELHNPIRLCGEMFGLKVIRHRLFETNWPLTEPKHIKHRGKVKDWRHGKYTADGYYVPVYGDGGGRGTTADWADAMDIDWMNKSGLRQAIPPAYTKYIGDQLMDYLTRNVTVVQ